MHKQQQYGHCKMQKGNAKIWVIVLIVIVISTCVLATIIGGIIAAIYFSSTYHTDTEHSKPQEQMGNPTPQEQAGDTIPQDQGEDDVNKKKIEKARAYSKLAACESNLKNLATALEMYATNNSGNYPPSLDYLTEDYGDGPIMKHMPECPACQKPYIYAAENSEKENDFMLHCGEKNVHKDADIEGDGYFPQYTPGKGLILE